ncbi:MAG: Txe/YoeB family addiction module toxin [Janthinobacterium lividum]
MRKLGRQLLWDREATFDFADWVATDIEVAKKINKLLLECMGDNPFKGTGKPEPLKHELQGFWSRRINHEHRLIYKVSDAHIFILACKDHY